MTEPSHLTPLEQIALSISRLETVISDLSTNIGVWREEAKVYGNQIQFENEEFQQIRQIFADKIQKLSTKKQELDSARTKAESELYSIKQELRDLNRQYSQALREAKLAEEIAKREAELLAKREAELLALKDKFEWANKAMPHQIEGGTRLAVAKRGLLADKRGLGKSLTSLIYIDLLQARKVLCIVPNDVQKNFMREIRMWAPHRNIVHLGGKKPGEREILFGFILPDMHDYIAVMNYEAWRRDRTIIDDLKAQKFDTIICDEAHMLKSRGTNAARGVADIVHASNICPMCPELKPKAVQGDWGFRTVCDNCGYDPANDFDSPEDMPFDLYCSIKNVLPMTGTPILNKPGDLFSLLNLINPVVFSGERDFLNEYCFNYGNNKWGFLPGQMERLVDKMKLWYVMRDRHDANIHIPPQMEQVYELSLTEDTYPDQWQAAKDLNDYGVLMLENALGEEEAFNLMHVISLILRKRQMMTWPAGIDFTDSKTGVHFKCDVTQSIKIDRCITHTDEDEFIGLIPEFVGEDERVVLFSQFKQPLIELERRLRLAGISVIRYDGDTPPAVANEVQIDFDRNYCRRNGRTPKWQVVLAHYKKGGIGLNFTDATQMIILDEEWNPGKKDQAYGRIDRMGQTEETGVHVLRVKNSVDEWLAALIESKADMISGFEDQVGLAQEMLEKMKNGEML